MNPQMPQAWVPNEPDEAPWQMMQGGEAPNFRPAKEGEPMCEKCVYFDEAGRKCAKFGQEAAPFMTCDANTPKPEGPPPGMMPPQGPPMGGMPPGMPPQMGM